MDTSIRLYNTNSRLRSTVQTDATSYATRPAEDEEDRSAEASFDEEERETDSISTQSASMLEEQVQRVDVADFEAIFIRFQGPITNFIYHLIGNREQAYDLAQDVFVKAYKALLNGTVVQPGAWSAWL